MVRRDSSANNTASQQNLFAINTEIPSCSNSQIMLEKRPKLLRIGEKLKKFLTQRDQQHALQFRRLFSDSLASDEQLISSSSCLYYNEEAERLIPGRLFASFGHLAFNANNLPVRFILSWRNNVYSVEKTNEKLLDMNGGIRVVLDNGIVCSFGSMSSPDKVFALLLRLWKASERSFELDHFESQSLLLKMGGTQTDGSHVGQTDTASETTDDTKAHEPANCDCTEHKGQLVVDSIYQLSARQLFKFLFTDNELMNEFLASTKRTRMNTETWAETNEQSRGKRKQKRTTTYTVELANTWGPKSSNVTEQQTLVEIGKQAADGYVIKKEAMNSGVPYADSFNIYCTYCITRVNSNSCRLQVHAGLEFQKSVMGMFKGFIERMSINGINDYYKNLNNYLHANSKRIQRESAGERLAAGQDFAFEALNRGSLRSLNESNDGYVSDLDEREDMTKKRLVRSLSYAAPRSNVVTSHTVAAGIDRALLIDINRSLQIIGLILLLLLLIQLWSSFSSKSTDNLLLRTEELLSRLVSHAQSTQSR
ncbi:GRAM domain containing protein [Aphelenchoides bicaudatus]|nr:GRAM domain containing protein [Aphelenchoides bicaudatus]